MKKILYTMLCALPMMVMAQKKVGVNTDTPSQTLDVEGTMRIAEPGPAKATNIPLAWDIDNQQVIKGINEEKNEYPFYYASFKIDMSRNNTDFANEVDLKIDTDKYVAVLAQSYLVDDTFSYGNPGASKAMIRVIAKSGNTEKLLSVKGYNTSRQYRDGKGWIDDNGVQIEPRRKLRDISTPYSIAIAQQDVRLIKDETAKTYKFFGDYKGTVPVGNRKFSWIVNVLIIDKDWVKTTDL